eukprot:scaffold71535_cov32-Prasinocladus_malaysianus.AAC.2
MNNRTNANTYLQRALTTSKARPKQQGKQFNTKTQAAPTDTRQTRFCYYSSQVVVVQDVVNQSSQFLCCSKN